MALISFGYRVDMYAIAPPTDPAGYIIAYDLDGILKQKNHLGIVSLVGSGTSGTSGSSGTSGVDGIAGGQLFYFNESVTGFTASYKHLGNSPVISSEEIVTKTLGPTESNVLMSSYMSDSLGLTVIPGGVQRFSLHYKKGASESNISTYVVVQLANQNGDKYYDLGATQAIAYSNTQEIDWSHNNTTNISLDIISVTTEIQATDRIVISLYTNNLDTTTQSVSFYTEGSNNYSYVQTSTAVVPGAKGATGHGVTSSFYLQGTNDYSYDTTSDIYRTGSLAIGTSGSSTSKLHVYATQSGGLQLEDGTQGDSYILVSDPYGIATWTASVPFLTGSYSVIRTLVDNSQLVPEKQYVINDYVHKYYIENTNTSNIKTYKTVSSIISNFIVFNNDYTYNLTVGMTVTIESLPVGYSGSLIVGQTTTVTQVASSYYFKFNNGMNNTSTSIGVVISFGLPRFLTLSSLTGATVSDTNLKVVMKPGGILNTDVHDGTIYGDMSVLENFAPPTEKLLLRARTSNTFYEEVESLTFKNDKAIYDINDSSVLNDNLEVISTRNGFISRRFNEVLEIDIDKDWRAQKYRRWLLPTEYRSNLLNLTLGTSSLNSHQNQYLYTSELVGTASNSYMYLGKSLETTDITLGASGSVVSYGITFSTNQINFKDYPIFKLDSSLVPVGVSRVKIDNLTDSVFIGNNTNFNYSLFVELKTLSSSTFQGNIIFYGINNILRNINSLSDIYVKGSSISLNNVNFLSTINESNINNNNITYTIFGSMKYNVTLSGYGSLSIGTPVRWFSLSLFNNTIGYSVLGCGTSNLNLNYSKLNGITLFKYGGILDIKNTQIGDGTIANTVQYKSLLVQNYFMIDSKLLNKNILVTSNISNFIVKTDTNGILYYNNIDIIAGSASKFYYNDTTKLYTSTNSGSIFYIRGGTSSAFDTTSDIYRTGSLNIGTGTATDGRFVVSSITGSVSFVVDNNGSIYNYSTSSNTKFGYLSLQNNTTGSNNTAFGTGSLYSNTSGGYNTAYGASSLYNNSTGVSTFVLSNPGSGYTMSTTFSNVQLSYISGSSASTYPTVTVFVGSGGTVSTVTLVTTGTGFKDTTTVMGTNLGSSATFSISVLTISTGESNTAVGAYSLWKNTTGSFNTALGDNSLIYNTTGSSNVAVGRSSLANNTTGGSNTALGAQTLQNNTTGSFNTTTGHSSLYYNTTGSYNTGNGYLSLQNNSNGISTFKLLDPGSGYTASSTFSNVQLSYISGSTASHVYGITYPKVTVFVGAGGTVSTVTLVTTGTGFIDTSTVMGANLGSATFSIGILTLLSGNYNTAVGAYSLGFNTIGYQNNAVGYGSLYNNISGYYNNAFGLQSLNQNTTGQLNVALGHQSLYNNTTGQQNTVAGYRSLYLNTVGSFNIAIGERALYSSIASSNTALGCETMFSNTTGTFNTSLGQESLRANIAGSYNTAVGTFALLNSQSDFTTAVGREAGRYSSAGNLIASTESLFLGYNSKSLTASSTNEIVIGASASGNGSNSVTLGSDSITKTILKGNIGVGTASPTNVLDVVKNQVGSTRINIENTDTYGISTLRFTKSGGAAAALYENATNEFTFQNATNGGTLRLQTTTSGGATNTALTIDSNQNIGVGIASPSTKLHIFGTQSGAFRLQDGTQAAGYVLKSDANGVGSWTASSSASYKVYTALLSQNTTSAPIAIVLENTLGVTVTYTYSITGEYIGTATGALTLNKTAFLIKNSNHSSPNYYNESIARISTDLFVIGSQINGVFANGILNQATIEIRVYN